MSPEKRLATELGRLGLDCETDVLLAPGLRAAVVLWQFRALIIVDECDRRGYPRHHPARPRSGPEFEQWLQLAQDRKRHNDAVVALAEHRYLHPVRLGEHEVERDSGLALRICRWLGWC